MTFLLRFTHRLSSLSDVNVFFCVFLLNPVRQEVIYPPQLLNPLVHKCWNMGRAERKPPAALCCKYFTLLSPVGVGGVTGRRCQPQVLRESRCNILFACHISKSPATREGNNWASVTCLLSSAHSSLTKPLVNPPSTTSHWTPSITTTTTSQRPTPRPSKSLSQPLMWRMCEGRKQNTKKLNQRGWCAGHGSPAWVASSSHSHTAALANCSDASGCKRTTNGKSGPGQGNRWKGILRKLLISQRGGIRPTWAACAMGQLLRMRVTWPHNCHSVSLSAHADTSGFVTEWTIRNRWEGTKSVEPLFKIQALSVPEMLWDAFRMKKKKKK